MDSDIADEQKVQQDLRLKENIGRIKNKIIVMSGKGGVGKTTVAVNLAYSLALKGYKVGILDVDIHGPNIAKMLGIEGKRLNGSRSGMEPVEVIQNLKAISIALLIDDPDKPIIWRGPLKMQMIKQFLSDVNWGDLDYLIIDAPPGTGDEPLSVCQLISDINGAIIVTTPQDVAVLDSRKSIQFAKEMKIPVIGIIENMSGFICPNCQKKINLFGVGGGEKAANDLEVPFLGRLPIEEELVKLGDEGKPFIQSRKEGNAVKNMNAIVDKIEEVSHQSIFKK
ncbi:MAG: Mrp/NBP35 family ATP-binding protein [Candidatus Omnitrophica bacterium]|nr:Mrp/NBP35 family ATP-binding protein [Candidatus Omnitrophota bacterium]